MYTEESFDCYWTKFPSSALFFCSVDCTVRMFSRFRRKRRESSCAIFLQLVSFSWDRSSSPGLPEYHHNLYTVMLLQRRSSAVLLLLVLICACRSTLICTRNRPDIRQSPVPAGYPAPFSGSGSGPAEENFARFLPKIFAFLRACFREKFDLLWYLQLA